MKAKFTVSEEEMIIYKDALRRKIAVTLPGAKGKHVMNNLDVAPLGDGKFNLSVEYGKAVKRGKNKSKSND